MKLTVLIENKADGNLAEEHGLSVHIEYNGKNYLLDTGASDKFAGNAEKLGVDLEKVDSAILSHAHYDHSSGYEAFFNKNSNAKVYLQKAARDMCYVKVLFYKEYIGIPKGLLDSYSDRFTFVDGDYKLDEGVWLIPHKTAGLEQRGRKAHLYKNTQKGIVADDFMHEQSLVFETEKGLVILNSCSHGGIDNIVEEVCRTLKKEEVAAVIGGFHLMGLRGTKSMGVKDSEVRARGKRRADKKVKHIYTCHCTGDVASRILKEERGDGLENIKTGKIMDW